MQATGRNQIVLSDSADPADEIRTWKKRGDGGAQFVLNNLYKNTRGYCNIDDSKQNKKQYELGTYYTMMLEVGSSVLFFPGKIHYQRL